MLNAGSKKNLKNDTNPLVKLNVEDSPEGDGFHTRDGSISQNIMSTEIQKFQTEANACLQFEKTINGDLMLTS